MNRSSCGLPAVLCIPLLAASFLAVQTTALRAQDASPQAARPTLCPENVVVAERAVHFAHQPTSTRTSDLGIARGAQGGLARSSFELVAGPSSFTSGELKLRVEPMLEVLWVPCASPKQRLRSRNVQPGLLLFPSPDFTRPRPPRRQ
jgi:hypothetical protein